MINISFSAIAYMPESAINVSQTFETAEKAIDFVEDWYIYFTPDERQTIKVLQDEVDITPSFITKVKDNLRSYGWAVDLAE